MSDIINMRGCCKHLPVGQIGMGCWMKKGHRGNHQYWIYRWRRHPGDAKATRLRLKRERQDNQNERRRDKRRAVRTKMYNASLNYYPKDY